MGTSARALAKTGRASSRPTAFNDLEKHQESGGTDQKGSVQPLSHKKPAAAFGDFPAAFVYPARSLAENSLPC